MSKIMKLQFVKTEEQKKAIKYFYSSGCLSSFFRISDQDYDQLLLEQLNTLKIKDKAMEKIGLDEEQLDEILPVCLYGFEFEGAPSKIGQDKILRSGKYSVAWLFFGESQIYIYKYILDMTSDNSYETTLEYFYKDITSFFTSSKLVESIGVSGCLNRTETKINRTYSSFTLKVPNDEFTCSTTGVSGIEESVDGMKQKIRERKIMDE